MMKRLTIVVFLLFITGIALTDAVSCDQEFSENENRYLQQFPEFSIGRLLDGRFTSEFEEYIQDQMPYRDKFIMVKALFNNSVYQKIQNNGVYIGDNELVNQFIVNDRTTIDENIAAVNNFGPDLDVMLVPTAAGFDSSICELAYNTNEQSLIADIYGRMEKDTIDVYSYLEGRDDIYFNTDHHWNSRGSYLGYQAYCESKGQKAYGYSFTEVSDDFRGTLYSRSGMFNSEPDRLYTINELQDADLDITVDGKEYNSLFFDSHLDEKDEYSYYLDGNHSLVEIENRQLDDGSSLLLIKDSYAHIFVPYLVNDYQRIYMVDLRFYRQPVSELVSEYGIEDVLMLYNIESFTSDRNIRSLR